MSDDPEDIWFERGGVRLYAAESGHGAPVVMLHGGLANHQAARLFAAPLSQRWRLITPDLRGSGRSHHGGALSWELLADDVAALLDHLGIVDAAVGGSSFGAGLALCVALRHPTRVRALIVLAPAYAGADVGLTPAQQAAMDAMDAVGRRAPAEGVQVLLPLFDALPDELRARARRLVETYDAASVAASTRFMASAAQPFERAAELAALDLPALVVPGLDETHPISHAEHLASHLPRATLRAATPPEYAAVIAEFLDEHGIG